MFAQNKTISGKSQPLRIAIQPEYKRGLPPNLFISMSFNDDNNNGILEADEGTILQLNIRNDGDGPA